METKTTLKNYVETSVAKFEEEICKNGQLTNYRSSDWDTVRKEAALYWLNHTETNCVTSADIYYLMKNFKDEDLIDMIDHFEVDVQNNETGETERVESFLRYEDALEEYYEADKNGKIVDLRYVDKDGYPIEGFGAYQFNKTNL